MLQRRSVYGFSAAFPLHAVRTVDTDGMQYSRNTSGSRERYGYLEVAYSFGGVGRRTGERDVYRGVCYLDDLTGNPYANVLLIKLELVAVAIAMGAYSRFRRVPVAPPRLSDWAELLPSCVSSRSCSSASLRPPQC